MYARKLHTRPTTANAELRRLLRGVLITTVMTVGLAAWCGSGIAHADDSHEQQACALMDDYGTAIHLGYSNGTAQYAFAVLSTEMPPVDAAHVLLAATRDDCPNHAADLPDDWR